MWRGLLVLLALTGCASLQSQFEDIHARRLDAVPGKSVIYVIRENRDSTSHPTVVMLDGKSESLTYPGTFVRWEVAPGPHLVTGFGADAGEIQLNALPGKFYFIRQTVSLIEHLPQSHFSSGKQEGARPAVERNKRVAAS